MAEDKTDRRIAAREARWMLLSEIPEIGDTDRPFPSCSWKSLKDLIYERDYATCWACGGYVPPEAYELGHIIDRVCGGVDEAWNLSCQCVVCNREQKPLHSSLEEAEHWRQVYRTANQLRLEACQQALKAALSRYSEADVHEANELLMAAIIEGEPVDGVAEENEIIQVALAIARGFRPIVGPLHLILSG